METRIFVPPKRAVILSCRTMWNPNSRKTSVKQIQNSRQGAFKKERGRPRPRVPASSWLLALKDTRTEASALLLERTLNSRIHAAFPLARPAKKREFPSAAPHVKPALPGVPQHRRA